MGLTLLYPKPGEAVEGGPVVDIVAVHGLNGDAYKTRTEPKSKSFWLQDFLPADLKRSRVFTFACNASVAFGNTTADIVDHARDLLGCLIDQREDDSEAIRPIIFIAHSLGGIVVK